MTPGPDFYQRIASGQDALLTEQVAKWEAARIGDHHFLCQITTLDNLALIGYIETGVGVLGRADLRIPTRLSCEYLGLTPDEQKKITETNNRQLALCEQETLKKWGLQIGQQRKGFVFSTLSSRQTDEYYIFRSVGARDEPWRELRYNEYKQKAPQSATGFTQVFEKTFPGWKITPLSPTELKAA